jgi:hypothetical protein
LYLCNLHNIYLLLFLLLLLFPLLFLLLFLLLLLLLLLFPTVSLENILSHFSPGHITKPCFPT